MKLKEFIVNHKLNTKIILSDKVSTANALIRQCNLREGVPCFNILAKTPLDLAREIWDALSEASGAYISTDSSVYIMMNVLRGMNSEMFPESTLTMGTVREVLNIVNELRENGVTDAYRTAVNDVADIKYAKLRELQSILEAYEQTLEERNLFDRCRILKVATDICKADAGLENEHPSARVLKAIPYLNGASFGTLSISRWTVAEKNFMDALVLVVESSLGTKKSAGDSRVVIDPVQPESDAGLSFYKARGIANEIRYAASKISKISQNESYGSIAIYYSSPEYISFIKAVLDAERIPYCVTEGKSTKELHLTQFIIAVLNAAEKDFSYALLEKVVRNKVITFDNVLPSMTLDQENPIRGYRNAMSEGIGWGKERYLDYYESKMKSGSEEGILFARFLYDFANVFDDSLSIGEIYHNLWDFVQKYTYAKNPEKSVLNNSLHEKWNELMLIDSASYTLSQKISFIRDMIENMKVEDINAIAGGTEGETGGETAVCVSPMKDFFIMERKHNFMLGLSATSFSVNDKQSPLILDDEKKIYINGAADKDSAVTIASENYEVLCQNVKDSLSTRSEDSDVTFSYSYYDTINLRDGSPSVLFLELSQGREEKADGYMEAPYMVTEDMIISSKNIEESVTARAEETRKNRDSKKTDSKKADSKQTDSKQSNPPEKLEMSASGIQTMLSCPLMYYYRYIKHLRIEEPKEPKGHVWLNEINKGNLSHYVLEKYMSRAANPAGGVDMALFEEAYAESLKEIELLEPSYSDEIKEREILYYRKKNLDYLQFLCKKWAEDLQDPIQRKEWKVIRCELPFGKQDETGSVNSVIKGKNIDYEIYLNGFIDRADGYMTEDGKLMLRIVDYKTGKKTNKENEIDKGVQIQHFAYAIALKDYLESDAGKQRCQELFGRVYTDYEFEWVGYTFPYATTEAGRLLNVLDKVEDITVFPDKILEQLDSIIGNFQTGDLKKLNEELNRLVNQKRLKRNESNDCDSEEMVKLSTFCKDNYCKYKNICRKWVGYSEYDEGDDE